MFAYLLSSHNQESISVTVKGQSLHNCTESHSLSCTCFALSVISSLSCNISFSFLIGSFLLVYKYTIIFYLRTTYLSVIQFLCSPHSNTMQELWTLTVSSSQHPYLFLSHSRLHLSTSLVLLLSRLPVTSIFLT